MNKRPDHPRGTNDAGERGNKRRAQHAEILLDADKLTELARKHYAEDFPNPNRIGCPDRKSFAAQAQAGRLPDGELRAHLFSCSECFREYRAALATRTVATPTIAWWVKWRNYLVTAFTLRPGLAWTSIALLLLTVTWLTWTRRHAEPRQSLPLATSETTQAHAPTSAPISNNPTPPTLVARKAESPLPPGNPAAQRRAAVTDAVTLASVDLNEYVALRDVMEGSGLGRRAIRLAPARTRLKLRLAEGSLAGAYTISLLDESDKPFATAKAVSPNGKALIADLDLRNAVAKSFRLRLQRRGEAPDFYPVLIEGKK